MNERRQLSGRQASAQLLRTLTDHPALPAFVQRLPAPVLKRLIEQVGINDAGSLIALTSPEQLREILEDTLWQTLIPGQAETLRPEKFVAWLDVLLEVGSEFTSERLIALGETFVVLNLAPLVEVLDAGVMAGHQEPPCDCVMCERAAQGVEYLLCHDHVVMARHDDEWGAIQAMLEALQDADPDFLQRVLSRCCNTPDARGFADDGQPLLADETHAREQRREHSGFVTPPMAAQFLKTAQNAGFAELLQQTAYDPLSFRYFQQLGATGGRQAPATTRSREAGAARLQRSHLQDRLTDETATAEESIEDEPQLEISPTDLRTLTQVLVAGGIIDEQSQPLRLAGPAGASESIPMLQGFLDRLQIMDPVAFGARLGELVFLANVLMAGSWYRGDRFRDDDAAQAALACANLGLEALLAEQRSQDPADRFERVMSQLEDVPGIVGLFRIGWYLLQSLPRRGAMALLSALRADHVREQLQRKRWIVEEIETALCNPDILDLIDQGEFEDVGDNLLLLNLILDVRACQCLRVLINDFPRYPVQLSVGFRPPQATSSETRYLVSIQQFRQVETFFESLDVHLKV